MGSFKSPSPLAGEGLGCGVGARLRAGRIDGIQYRCGHAVTVGQHVVVPESQDTKALRGQIGIAIGVISIFDMLPAVGFDNQPIFEADEVSNVRSEEHTSELKSLMRSQYAVFCLKKTTE